MTKCILKRYVRPTSYDARIFMSVTHLALLAISIILIIFTTTTTTSNNNNNNYAQGGAIQDGYESFAVYVFLRALPRPCILICVLSHHFAGRG